jgi:hypothetical protein
VGVVEKTFIADPNPWHPMSEPQDIKVIGKFIEEVCEGGSAAARCLIQGISESEPSTGVPNREWLTKEIGDILGNAELVIEHFGLDYADIRERAEFKKEHLRRWHEMA